MNEKGVARKKITAKRISGLGGPALYHWSVMIEAPDASGKRKLLYRGSETTKGDAAECYYPPPRRNGFLPSDQ